MMAPCMVFLVQLEGPCCKYHFIFVGPFVDRRACAVSFDKNTE